MNREEQGRKSFSDAESESTIQRDKKALGLLTPVENTDNILVKSEEGRGKLW